MTGRTRRLVTESGAGIGLVAVHVLAGMLMVSRCERSELAVGVSGQPASERLALVSDVPADLASDVEIETMTPPGAGLAYREWRIRYRGGLVRAVGAAQLVGPFQEPGARTCAGRVMVSQRMLDELAPFVEREVSAALDGQTIVGAGAFRRVRGTRLEWADLATRPRDRGFVGDAPNGYVSARLVVELERVSIPVTIAMVPSRATDGAAGLALRIATRAEVAFDNRVVQWIADKLGVDRVATRVARGEVDRWLVRALAPPPPIDLDGTQRLTFDFCDDPVEIVDRSHGAVPFAIRFGAHAVDPLIRPPRLGRGPRVPIDPAALVAIDLELDGVNAALYELWRGGFLDRQLAAAGLDRRFNSDPRIARLVSVRVSPPRLALPPVVRPSSNDRLRLAADARITIEDRATRSVGRVFGAVDLAAQPTGSTLGAQLGELALSCERRRDVLVPCYADLVGAIRARTPELHGPLTDALTSVLAKMFEGRTISDPSVPVALRVRAARPRIAIDGTTGTIHLDLDAEITSTRYTLDR